MLIPKVVELLKSGKVHIYEPGLDDLVKRNFEQGRLKFTTNLAEGLEDALACVYYRWYAQQR